MPNGAQTVRAACRRALVALSVLAFAHVPVPESVAAPVSHTLTGTVSSVATALQSDFSVGQSVTYQIVFDAATPDNDPSPMVGEYLGAFLSAAGTIGTYAFAASGPQSVYLDDNLGGTDGIGMDAAAATGAVLGAYTPDTSELFNLTGPDSALSTDSLSALPPVNLTSFTLKMGHLAFTDNADLFFVQWEITSWTVTVPWASSLVLVALGAGGLVSAGRRARKA